MFASLTSTRNRSTSGTQQLFPSTSLVFQRLSRSALDATSFSQPTSSRRSSVPTLSSSPSIPPPRRKVSVPVVPQILRTVNSVLVPSQISRIPTRLSSKSRPCQSALPKPSVGSCRQTQRVSIFKYCQTQSFSPKELPWQTCSPQTVS